MSRYTNLEQSIEYISITDEHSQQLLKRRKRSVFPLCKCWDQEIALNIYLNEILEHILQTHTIFADQLTIEVPKNENSTTHSILAQLIKIKQPIPFYHLEIKGSDFAKFEFSKEFFKDFLIFIALNPQLHSITIHTDKLICKENIDFYSLFFNLNRTTYIKITFSNQNELNLTMIFPHFDRHSVKRVNSQNRGII